MHRLEPPHRYLMGPGPSPVEGSVLAAQAKPVVGHLDPYFLKVMDEVSAALRTVFQTANQMTFPASGTGSAGMEMAVHNLVEPGDVFVVGVNGVFGGRMAEVAKRAGAEVIAVDAPWGEAVSTDRIAETARRHHAKVVGVVHAETSTGVRQPIEELRPALGPEPLLLVDAVTSLGGIEIQTDDWGVDACYSGTQKCLSVPPGLAPMTFSDRAVHAAARRSEPVRSWYLDLNLLAAYWKDGSTARAYHHTAPISAIYGLHEGLRLVLAEGLESRWRRHSDTGRFLQDGLERLGFEMVAPAEHRLPQLTAARFPDGVDDAKARASLLHDHQIEIGGGLGPFAGSVWRVGMMGAGAKREHAIRLLQAIPVVIR